MKRLALLFFLLTAPLFAIMPEEYNDIMLGTPVSALTQKLGPPYAVTVIAERSYEYIYVDRFSQGGEFLYAVRYIFTVVNGQVVEKRTETINAPPYDQLWRVDPNYPTYP